MPTSKRRPNIVYILADDMGYGDVSCLNPDSQIRTTNIDRLASTGMRFTDVHACSSVCTPSRYGILTGRYCWRSPLKRGVLWGYSSHLIAHDRMTVPGFLKQYGYDTACFGKWHLGMDFPTTDGQPASGDESGSNVDWASVIPHSPLDNGFDHFFGISASLDMPPYVYIQDNQFLGIPTEIKAFLEPNRPGPAHKDFEAIDVLPTITQKAVEYIDRQPAQGNPFFLYMPLNAPHTPTVPTAEFLGKSHLNAYGDFCLQVDWTVGQVMEALERNGMAENTLFIFTSDNGCSPMADFDFLHDNGHRPSFHFRGHKADIYEGGHRIPYIACWPEVVPSGRICDATVCLTDLMATVADIMDTPLPDHAGEDSISNLPLLEGGQPDLQVRDTTVHHSIEGMFSIRQGHWKLERCPGSGGWSFPKDNEAVDRGLPPLQLYNLHNDIGEQYNIQAEHPDIVEDLTLKLTRIVEDGRSTPGPLQQNDGPSHWDQLNWIDT